MSRRIGRPRVNREQKILTDDSAHHREMEELVRQRINLKTRGIMAYEAACLLLEIERGAEPSMILHKPIFTTINDYAKKKGPHGKWLGPCGPRYFLEEFLKTHAPNFDWRADARQGEVEDRDSRQENEQVAKEIAEDVRYGMALATKFHTPDAPDGMLLYALAWERRRPGQRRAIHRTWPTLRELKLATAIPERVMQNIMTDLRPRKGEIIKEPVRHKLSRRGAVPLRYGPRLIVAVLAEFVNRLPDLPIDGEERKRLRRTAILVKRAFAARLGRSG